MVIFTAWQNLANLNEVENEFDCQICEFGRESPNSTNNILKEIAILDFRM